MNSTVIAVYVFVTIWLAVVAWYVVRLWNRDKNNYMDEL